MRIEWVRILPRGYNFLSMMIIEQLLQSSLISTSKLRVSLKTGSRVFTFGEQNFENSKSTIISTPPSLWFSFSWQAAQIRWTSGSARKGLGKSHNDQWLSFPRGSSVRFPEWVWERDCERHDHHLYFTLRYDHTVRLKSWYHLYHDH